MPKLRASGVELLFRLGCLVKHNNHVSQITVPTTQEKGNYTHTQTTMSVHPLTVLRHFKIVPYTLC